VQIIQPFDEEQVCNLLDDFEWVGDAARPKRIPQLINLLFQFTGNHRFKKNVESSFSESI